MKPILTVVLLGNLTLTAYRSVPEQTDSTPFITASGETVHPHGVALSRNLLERWGGSVKYGDLVYIDGYGFKVVNDTMNSRHVNCIDIWVETYEDEKAIPIQKQKVYLIEVE